MVEVLANYCNRFRFIERISGAIIDVALLGLMASLTCSDAILFLHAFAEWATDKMASRCGVRISVHRYFNRLFYFFYFDF